MTIILAGILIGTLCVLIPFADHLPLPGAQAAYAQSTSQPATESPITFSGGPGNSPKTAVVIAGAPNSVAGIAAEYQYLDNKFGRKNVDWRLRRQILVRQDGKIYDRMEIELKKGGRKTVFFDISGFFGKP